MTTKHSNPIGGALIGGVAVTALALAGCPGDPMGNPDAASLLDAYVTHDDSGTTGNDGGGSSDDAFSPGTDAFSPGADAVVTMPDAFSADDAFVPWPTDPCAQITRVRALSGGTLPEARPVTGAVVTYLLGTQPTGATDPLGFFVQCPGTEGPALFVAVDPTTLTPAPAVGDEVSFDVVAAVDAASGAGSTGDQHRVTEISGYMRTAMGMTIAPQDVSALDLPAMIDAHESELVTLTGTVAAAGAAAGTGYTSYQVTTAGFPTAGPTLRMRLPTALATSFVPTLTTGCTVAIGPTPLWRFTTTAQPSAWQPADITVMCPTPVPAAGEVFVSEIGYQFMGSDTDKEFIELHNPSATVTYDLGGCILSDSDGPTSPSALTFPAGTLLGAGADFVIAGSASEITGDLVLPGALAFDADDSVQLTCGGTVIDDVTWTASGIGGTNDVSAQLDLAQVGAMGAANNDMAANWCTTPMGSTYGASMYGGTPGAPNVACMAAPACTPATHVVISEIDYDQPGADTAEFVELHNPTGAAIDVTGWTLVAINGGSGATMDREYARVALTGMIAADGYLLVTASGSTVTGATLSLSAAIQNGGPDAIVLLDGAGAIVDTAVYEGMMTRATLMGGTMLTLTETGSIGTDSGANANEGLSRNPSGCDRDMPAMDWHVAATTPGAANM